MISTMAFVTSWITKLLYLLSQLLFLADFGFYIMLDLVVDIFIELGFYYVVPIDGHDVENFVQIFENVKKSNHQGPVLIHVRTQKGKGYKPAEESGDKYHGVSKFNISTGEQSKSTSNTPSYTKVFAETLIKHAEQDTKIIGNWSYAFWYRIKFI